MLKYAEKMTEKFLKDGIILPEEVDIIRYGLDTLGNNGNSSAMRLT